MALLEVRNLTKRFGGLVANHRINLDINEGEIVGLIGPNGAGKTTLFNCIAGYYKPDEGTVRFMGKDITGHPPERVCKEGIARTFQLVKIFKDMTVLENVMVGALARARNTREARELAIRRMVEEAKRLGADAVVGLRLATAQTMAGAAEVLAYGTAVRLK